jgi:hypothetical protein
MFLTGCGVFDRGNYEKDREGFVINDGLIVKYHTNSIGEIDIFMIDSIFTFFEALDYTNFDSSILDDDALLSSMVSSSELDSCGIERDEAIPRFIRIGDTSYYYNVRNNGQCSYDAYRFDANGYTDEIIYNVEEVSPVEPLNITKFRDADFIINPFEEIVFIETISYNTIQDRWVKELVTVLPMSYTQAGNTFEELSETMEELEILEQYVLENQSINLLQLVENYKDEEVSIIWSDDTIEALGRDHEVIKNVRSKSTDEVLDMIRDTLTRLGMFQ